ncbi:hypothetical protein X798_00887 [Onchocerca flexuosa]|uniref:Uncharacterized protein n=1 Tax=Onchocerca flexuosa TaxID=387005 RepID=A0A238C5E3_9BILA|nr:hypothetical protein X798_00887 [Onchocerca flexuosa]
MYIILEYCYTTKLQYRSEFFIYYCRRSSPIISPLQQQSNLTYGNTTPTVYPRVLGVTNWTAQITTPLRNTGAVSKILDHQKENELNLVAVTPPTMTNLNKMQKS